jgi:hypothetical protein
MKSLMLFLRNVFTDSEGMCSASTLHDLKTIEQRIEGEGKSFLTITLPIFGKDFEKALAQGFVDPSMFLSFKKHRCLPAFLQGFTGRVFDAGTGQLLDDPDIKAIRSVRQLTLMFGKMEALCSSEREYAAMSGYVELDRKVGIYDAELRFIRNPRRGEPAQPRSGRSHDDRRESVVERFAHVSRLLWRGAFTYSSNELYDEGLRPKHGPGATADGLKGNFKFHQLEWTERLDEYFPFGEYAFPNWRSYMERSDLRVLEPGAERPSKVISVPKTMKTPRLIAVEPTCMQYMQQGMLDLFIRNLRKWERGDKVTPHLWKMIGFDDQTPNQRMAQMGSIDGAYATLDLSEASDRVSMWHVETLLENHQFLLGAVLACRSSKASVLGKTISLNKFASMGSALCFPFEAMVFLTAVLAGISMELNRPLNEADIKSFSSQVRVFGDDIIVPQRFALAVVETLELLGFKVNSSKSFWTGRFRESCGKEYYGGLDVSIVKVRQELPTQRRDTQEIISAVSMRNQFFELGYARTVEFLDSLIGGLIPFPEIEPSSPILGRYVYGPVGHTRLHPDLQHSLVRGVVARPVKVRREIDSWPALMKWFLKDSDLPFIDQNHLVYSGRPASLTLKAGWHRPF